MAWPLVVLVCSSVGCAIVDGAEEGAIFGMTTSGLVSLGFEDSTFLPCESAEAWWLSSYDGVDLWQRYDEQASKPHERLFAVLRGDRSREGSYGHLGGYDRTFVVADVIELRPAGPDDCRSVETADTR